MSARRPAARGRGGIARAGEARNRGERDDWVRRGESWTAGAGQERCSEHPPNPGRGIASHRELKSALAAPGGADAAPPKGEGLASQEGERFVARGEDSLAAGNVAVAREFFLRAADAGVARGALLLASTYDPYELVGLHVVGVQPNTALAQRWYQRAEALGEKLASERIARLERH